MGDGGGYGLDEMQPIFRQIEAEWANQKQEPSSNHTDENDKPFIFHVHNNGRSTLFISLSDFHTNTFQAIKSYREMEDMREMAGFGGPWTDFVDYMKEAFTSEDLKIVLEGKSKFGGAVSARVISQKSGMPKISISLNKLVSGAASEAMANITVELLKLYKNDHELLIDEQSKCYQRTIVLAAVQENCDVLQGQLDASIASRALVPYISCQENNDATQMDLDSSLASYGSSLTSQEKKNTIQSNQDCSSNSRAFSSVSQNTSGVQTAKTMPSSKVTNPVVPFYPRLTVEEVILIDSDDERG